MAAALRYGCQRNALPWLCTRLPWVDVDGIGGVACYATKATGAGAKGGKDKAPAARGEKKPDKYDEARPSGGDKDIRDMILRAFTPRPRPSHTPEELKEAEEKVKNYCRMKTRQHNHMMKDIANKLKLRDAALAALPPSLRRAASEPDFTPFPGKRLPITDTPPLPKYRLK
eukprot:jgi/Mesvir1/28714/Mv19684-RA.1